jgi:protein-S-isoprenylcysteine O-methyltransferase Ste14
VSALRTSIFVTWGVFWVYWLISAFGAKKASRHRWCRPEALAFIIFGGVVIRSVGVNRLAVHSVILQVVGVIVFLLGLGLAVWARIILGRNWGMPMTEKEEPELVTSGPYRFVRHPIYSGIMLGVLGTALATNISWLVVFGVIGAFFIFSARVEERLLTKTFPNAYPTYMTNTKMLIPFVI